MAKKAALRFKKYPAPPPLYPRVEAAKPPPRVLTKPVSNPELAIAKHRAETAPSQEKWPLILALGVLRASKANVDAHIELINTELERRSRLG